MTPTGENATRDRNNDERNWRDEYCPCCGDSPENAAEVEIERSDGRTLHGAACENCGNVYIP